MKYSSEQLIYTTSVFIGGMAIGVVIMWWKGDINVNVNVCIPREENSVIESQSNTTESVIDAYIQQKPESETTPTQTESQPNTRPNSPEPVIDDWGASGILNIDK